MTLEGYPQLTTLVAIVLSGPLRTGARAGGGGAPSCNWSSGHVSWVEGPWGQDSGAGKG